MAFINTCISAWAMMSLLTLAVRLVAITGGRLRPLRRAGDRLKQVLDDDTNAVAHLLRRLPGAQVVDDLQAKCEHRPPTRGASTYPDNAVRHKGPAILAAVGHQREQITFDVKEHFRNATTGKLFRQPRR